MKRDLRSARPNGIPSLRPSDSARPTELPPRRNVQFVSYYNSELCQGVWDFDYLTSTAPESYEEWNGGYAARLKKDWRYNQRYAPQLTVFRQRWPWPASWSLLRRRSPSPPPTPAPGALRRGSACASTWNVVVFRNPFQFSRVHPSDPRSLHEPLDVLYESAVKLHKMNNGT